MYLRLLRFLLTILIYRHVTLLGIDSSRLNPPDAALLCSTWSSSFPWHQQALLDLFPWWRQRFNSKGKSQYTHPSRPLLLALGANILLAKACSRADQPSCHRAGQVTLPTLGRGRAQRGGGVKPCSPMNLLPSGDCDEPAARTTEPLTAGSSLPFLCTWEVIFLWFLHKLWNFLQFCGWLSCKVWAYSKWKSHYFRTMGVLTEQT